MSFIVLGLEHICFLSLFTAHKQSCSEKNNLTRLLLILGYNSPLFIKKYLKLQVDKNRALFLEDL